MHNKTRNILAMVRNDLQSGRFGEDFLLSERQLKSLLGIGRGAVRAILAQLEEEKRIFRVPGKGMRINPAFNRSEKFRRFLTVISAMGLYGEETLQLLSGVSEAAAARAAEMVLAFHMPELGIGVSPQKLISEGNYDGVIFIENLFDDALETARQRNIPAVVLNQELGKPVSAVIVDYRQVGRTMGRYLVSKGHTDIGFINGDDERFIYKEMLAGIKGALSEDDLTLNSEFCFRAYNGNYADVKEELVRKLKNSAALPTAFIAGRDVRARVLYQACGECGLRIPEDISVISYDNISWDEGAAHGLTTVAQPAREMGAKAFEMIFNARICGTFPEVVKLPGSLIEKSSVRELIHD